MVVDVVEWDQLCRWVIGAKTGHDWGQLTTMEEVWE